MRAPAWWGQGRKAGNAGPEFPQRARGATGPRPDREPDLEYRLVDWVYRGLIIADARQILGVGDARNRTRRAVERTVPFGLICFSVVTVWYALHGHAPDEVASHRSRARWYTTKTEPSYDDMAVKLRRVIIAARFHGPCPEQVTPQETRAVLAAWAAAGT